jgi:hypothetical protein
LSERTIIAVVSELRATGLTVEQQILVDELVMLAISLQAGADVRGALEAREEEKRAINRERMRSVRERARTCMHVHAQVPSPSPPMIINNSTPSSPPLKPSVSFHQSPSESLFFEEFWKVYPRRVGVGAARKAYRNALKRGTAEEILAGAKRYAASNPELEFTKHPSTWLNADCWLDEGKVIDFRTSAPQRTYAEIKAEREAKEQSQ